MKRLKRLAMITWTLAILIGSLVTIRPPSAVDAQKPAGLHVDGVLLKDATGERFIISGTNVEAYRDYANGCGWVTDGMYTVRNQMADTLKSWGVNMVRLNYSYRFLQQGSNLSKYLDFAQSLAERGIYVMPADHTFTGQFLTNSGASHPTMKAIVDGMRARGIEAYLVGLGLNEPGPIADEEPQRSNELAGWKRAYENLITYLRTTAAFDGVIVVDGTGWSTLLDISAFQSLMAFDANLRGGTPNLLFSHHIYPNIRQLPAQIWAASNKVPLIMGEAGIENPGASAYDPAFLRSVISGYLNTGMNNGHNGLMSWQFAWCDSNKLVRDWVDPAVPYKAPFVLTEHGNLWLNDYHKKLPTTNPPPPPATIIVQQPTGTPSRTPSRTALPTNTPRPPTATRTVTPPSPTVTPTAEVWTVIGTIGDMPINITITKR